MLSVILPIYNEELGLEQFVADLLPYLGDDYEVIFVNDGSSDNSLNIITTLCAGNPQLKYINLSRNFGHQIAVSAGIDFAKGDRVVLIDSDGQDPPYMIPKMLDKMEEGFDVVYAKRIKRENESFLKKLLPVPFIKS
jgi:glycosyltransferase involved in cell wall biosynthesis